MTLEPGQLLLHYRLVAKLGEGGMGVVWKAVDTTLDREVAIKVLPEAFAADADRLARFEREAKMLAALNHPNIAAVYSVHSDGDRRFLAMELVEGEDLAERLTRGPLALDETIDVAGQIAEALETAHDSGVIHRDLKPANVQMTPEGKVKVLDFGLAKALASDPASSGTNPALSPTITSTGTLAGTLLGTAAYMSPEQARGRAVDRRADVWAFGCVVFEMLTGQTLFRGETVSDTLASVLKTEPDWDALPGSTPRALHRVLERCLTKDPERRLSHIAGARADLREAEDRNEDLVSPGAGEQRQTSPTWLRALPWGVASLAIIAALYFGIEGQPTTVGPQSTMNLSIELPSLHYSENQMGVMALSPDGTRFVIAMEQDGRRHLYLRNLDDPEMVRLEDTENATSPFFSPDSQWIGFFNDAHLRKVSVEGGNAVAICPSPSGNRGASWGSDGRIVFAAFYTQALLRVPATGGEPTSMTELDFDKRERTHRWPQYLPDHDLLLFTVGTVDSPEFYDSARIDAVRPSTGERKTVLEGASMARYVESGHLVFGRDGFLFAQPFDLDRLEAYGAAVPVADDVEGVRGSGRVHAEISRTGHLAYIAGSRRDLRHKLVWRYLDGRVEDVAAPVQRYDTLGLSPDGKRLAVSVAGETTFDIWIYHFEHETMTRLTFDGDNSVPVWAPDGRRVAFTSTRGGRGGIYIKNADGSGEAEQLFAVGDFEDAGSIEPASWSPDGKHLLVYVSDRNASNIYVANLDGVKTVEPLVETPSTEYNAQFSPDGRFFTYTSDVSGSLEVYVRSFPGPGGKWQISPAGGFQSRWSGDGRQLYYTRGRDLLVVDIDTTSGLRAGSPREALSSGLTLEVGSGFGYDVDPGALRVLSTTSADPEGRRSSVQLVVNWLDAVRRRVPVD